MALIKCPECGKDISNIAVVCIYCGFPVWENTHLKTAGNYNTSKAEIKIELSDKQCPVCKVAKPHTLKDNIKDTCSICGYVFNQEFVNQNQHLLPPKPVKKPVVPTCPHCGSTHIEAVQRGYSIIWGFLGSGQTMNYCKSCGHKWNP